MMFSNGPLLFTKSREESCTCVIRDSQRKTFFLQTIIPSERSSCLNKKERMKIQLLLPICIFLLLSFVSADNNQDAKCPVPKTTTSIPAYFEEMNAILKLLSVWEPSTDSRPSNATFERSAKRLMKLGKTMDQATQELQNVQGNLDDESVIKIDKSLQISVRYIDNITTLTKLGKESSDKYNYTTQNVQIIQGVTSQYLELFKALVVHINPASYGSIGYSMSRIICDLVDTLDYLQPGAYPAGGGGKEFCKSLKTNVSQPPSYESISKVFNPPASFTQCGNSVTAMFKYATEKNLLGKPQTSAWCPSNDDGSTNCTYHPTCAFY